MLNGELCRFGLGCFSTGALQEVLQCISARLKRAAVDSDGCDAELFVGCMCLLHLQLMLQVRYKCVHDDCFVSECRVLLKDPWGPMLGI